MNGFYVVWYSMHSIEVIEVMLLDYKFDFLNFSLPNKGHRLLKILFWVFWVFRDKGKSCFHPLYVCPQAGLMGILANRHFRLHESIPENFSFITILSEIYPKTTTLIIFEWIVYFYYDFIRLGSEIPFGKLNFGRQRSVFPA